MKQNEHDQIQAQIGVSISLARSLVASWLPPSKDAAEPTTTPTLIHRRAPRAGLGSTEKTAMTSVEDLKIQRTLLQKEKKLKQTQQDKRKKGRADENSDDDRPEKGQKKRKSDNAPYDSYTKKQEGKARGFGR